MKTKLSLLSIGLISLCSYAQIQFEEHLIYSNPSNPAGSYSLDAGDIDNDGDSDILVGTKIFNGTKSVLWLENLGGNNFAQPIEIKSIGVSLIRDAKFFDADQDGNLDVIIVDSTSEPITIYFGDGTGSFSTQLVLDNPNFFPDDVEIADWDGDGLQDIIISKPNWCTPICPSIEWYRNLGNGNFSNIAHIIYVIGNIYNIRTGYINDDSNLDMLLTQARASFIRDIIFIPGDGNGGSTVSNPEIIFTTPSPLTALTLGDFNNDTTTDFVVASSGDDFIRLHTNDGNANFSSGTIISNANHPLKVESDDLNNDGHKDLLYSSGGEKITFALNDASGNGSFDPQVINTNSPIPSYISISDINGDGNLDFVTLDFDQQRTAWYENIPTLGINENTLENISIFPNPTTSKITVETNNYIVINSLHVFSLYGQFIKESTSNEIDLTELATGMYFIKVQTSEGVLTKRIIKE